MTEEQRARLLDKFREKLSAYRDEVDQSVQDGTIAEEWKNDILQPFGNHMFDSTSIIVTGINAGEGAQYGLDYMLESKGNEASWGFVDKFWVTSLSEWKEEEGISDEALDSFCTEIYTDFDTFKAETLEPIYKEAFLRESQ